MTKREKNGANTCWIGPLFGMPNQVRESDAAKDDLPALAHLHAPVYRRQVSLAILASLLLIAIGVEIKIICQHIYSEAKYQRTERELKF
ncbi:hypothetical protein VNO77_33366 [Canavalia gladiata]|uniref:Uncharacterized protein n=1 Tax=Canavalia gladiata TaxID=3824 RepID=A0AAN9Q0I6_CANGL